MSKWDEAEKATEKSERGSLFIRLKDGDSIEGVFMGEPDSAYYSFDKKKYYGNKEAGTNYRFRIAFALKEGSEWSHKIIEQGTTFLQTLIGVKGEYGIENIFKIKRTGSGKDDTIYHILYKSPLATTDKVKLDQLDKIDISFPFEKKEIFDDIPMPTDEDNLSF